jgi:hypothetical protein
MFYNFLLNYINYCPNIISIRQRTELYGNLAGSTVDVRGSGPKLTSNSLGGPNPKAVDPTPVAVQVCNAIFNFHADGDKLRRGQEG